MLLLSNGKKNIYIAAKYPVKINKNKMLFRAKQCSYSLLFLYFYPLFHVYIWAFSHRNYNL